MVKSVLVTGCSSGLGLETAIFLAQRGMDVYASMRDLGRRGDLDAAAARSGVQLKVLRLDVTDRGSIDEAVGQVVSQSGGVYGLVNNAAVMVRGCFEDVREEDVRRVYETNVFGTMAVTRRVLPHMRGAGRGRIVTVTSVGGRIAGFGLSAYCSSKFALEGWAEALALEIAPFGLHSVLIEPGITPTTYWTRNRGVTPLALDPRSPYAAMFQRAEQLADRMVERSRNRPQAVAAAIHQALTTSNPRLRYLVGQPANLVVTLRRYLPSRLFERVYFGYQLRQLTRGSSPS